MIARSAVGLRSRRRTRESVSARVRYWETWRAGRARLVLSKETLWGRREGAQAVVNQMGLRAYLADDVEGWHSSWTPYQVARLCRWATEWHAANPVAAIGGA